MRTRLLVTIIMLFLLTGINNAQSRFGERELGIYNDSQVCQVRHEAGGSHSNKAGKNLMIRVAELTSMTF